MSPLFLLAIGVAVVVGGILVLRLHAFLALILAALVVAALTPDSSLREFARSKGMSESQANALVSQPMGKRVAVEFGNSTGSIGIVIALAAVIGACMLESGSADRIVRSAVRWVGEKRAPLAFWGTGYTLGIPVFFDTVFYLVVPLAKAMRLRTGRNYALYVMTVACGATMTHSLVPPTPGPLAVADQLNINLGQMIIGGMIVGMFTSTAGVLYAIWTNRRIDIPLRDSTDAPLTELVKITERPDHDLPPFGLAMLPILLPVILIGGDSVIKVVYAGAEYARLRAISGTLGDANLSLALATAIALLLVLWKRQGSDVPFTKSVQSALLGGGEIILITAAGGAFGKMLEQTGVGRELADWSTHLNVGIIPLAWLIAVMLKTALGSATVSMITSASMVSALLVPAELGFHPIYVALAIGCGSKMLSWLNDSGFWVVSRMGGLTVGETLRCWSVMLAIMSIVGLVVVMTLAKLFPLTGMP